MSYMRELVAIVEAVVAKSPNVPSEIDGSLSCFWCSCGLGEEHEPDCVWMRANRAKAARRVARNRKRRVMLT